MHTWLPYYVKQCMIICCVITYNTSVIMVSYSAKKEWMPLCFQSNDNRGSERIEVSQITPGGVAEKCGMKMYDKILKVSKKLITAIIASLSSFPQKSPMDVARILASHNLPYCKKHSVWWMFIIISCLQQHSATPLIVPPFLQCHFCLPGLTEMFAARRDHVAMPHIQFLLSR